MELLCNIILISTLTMIKKKHPTLLANMIMELFMQHYVDFNLIDDQEETSYSVSQHDHGAINASLMFMIGGNRKGVRGRNI